jgi:putative sigma-54 modulation protein
MVELSITAKHVELSERLEKYVRGKVSKLEKYVPRAARSDIRVEVRLVQKAAEGAPGCACELTLHLPQVTLVASETTQHIYAAVDVAVAHVGEQLKTYKAKHAPGSLRKRTRRRMNREDS